jgi:hypothetical protein
MKNFKQIAFGLIVGALAIGFSAFTNAKKVVSVNAINAKYSITANFLVQPALDSFERETSASTDNCSSVTSDRDCVYDVTTTGKSNIPNQASYTKAEIDNYVSHSWIMPDAGASLKLYNP